MSAFNRRIEFSICHYLLLVCIANIGKSYKSAHMLRSLLQDDMVSVGNKIF